MQQTRAINTTNTIPVLRYVCTACCAFILAFVMLLVWTNSASAEEASDSADSFTEQPVTMPSIAFPSDVCVVARITASPSETNHGASVQPDTQTIDLDWEKTAHAAENVSTLCSGILENPSLRLSLAISPLLLDVWLNEEADNDNGSLLVATLEAAMETGRLELVLLGFADPSLTVIEQAAYIDDINLQYDLTRETIPLAFSQGTVPIDLTLPAEAANKLETQSIAWTAVDSSLIQRIDSGSSVDVFTYSNNRNLSILGVDTTSASSFITSSSSAALNTLKDFQLQYPQSTYATVVELDGNEQAASNLIATLSSISASTQFRLCTASNCVKESSSSGIAAPLVSVRQETDTIDSDSSANTEQEQGSVLEELTSARKTVHALESALYSSSKTYDQALRLILLSEFGNWSSAQATGASYARTASELAQGMLDGIHISSEQMVLAGKSGIIPVFIQNDTDAAFKLPLDFIGRDALVVTSASLTDNYETVIYSGENYEEVPVELSNAQDELTIQARVNDYIITQETVQISTSHINTVTIIVLILGSIGGIVFVLRRHEAKKKQAA